MEFTVTQITLSDIERVIQQQFDKYFQSNNQPEPDEIGGIELAIEETGLARPTIYSLVSARKIPHSKKSKKLYFSRLELREWLRSGKRKTADEIAAEAENFTPKTTRHKSILSNR